MKTYIQNNKTTCVGYVMILLSAILFHFGGDLVKGDFYGVDDFSKLFIFNYLIAIVFLIMTFGDKIRIDNDTKRKFKLQNTTVALVLFNISAYSLNRDLVVFRESTEWLTVFLIVFNLAFMLYGIKDLLPKWAHIIIVIILSMGIVFHVYQAISIAHLSAMGIIVCWFFGISLHALVPISFVILTGLQLKNYLKENNQYKSIIMGALGVVTVILISFSVKYNSIHSLISRSENLTNSYNQEQNLPKWVAVSQKLTDDYFTEKVLKADLIYQTFDNGFWDFSMNSLNDKRLHDPLVSFADLFVDHRNDLNTADRLKIIKSLFGFRHLTEERLWSNRDLRTKSIISNIELFPKERLSYTEYFVTVRNISSRGGNQNEAIYTFDLPEGSAVSSLSLWINGKEEKAILTTKGLAKTAYKTIVGVERRDPSLIQWKEGNKISVRVFPCTPEEDRQFKIGITSPLKYEDEKLTYQSIKIEGEHVLDAQQYLKIINEDITLEAENISLDRSEEFDYEGTFNQEFRLSFPAPANFSGEFVWKEKRYKLVEPTFTKKTLDVSNVYLDLNQNWESGEVNELMTALPNSKFWVFGNERIELNASNKSNLLKRHQKKRFTLFPFHKLEDASAVVITKENHTTPNLTELQESDFGQNLKTLITQNKTDITLINIGGDKKDYIQSLSELSVFDYHKADLSTTTEILQLGAIDLPVENENLIYLPQSKLSIEKSDGALTGIGNNHIYRLFAYQDILNRIGISYFDETYLNQELIDLASDANIVTPLSSLIVLETQADYDRFGIKKDNDSLGNASLGNSGAVPEPHEWALIVMLIGFVFFTAYKKRQNAINHA